MFIETCLKVLYQAQGVINNEATTFASKNTQQDPQDTCDLERNINTISFCILIWIGLIIYAFFSLYTLKTNHNQMQGKMSQLIVVYLSLKTFLALAVTALIVAQQLYGNKNQETKLDSFTSWMSNLQMTMLYFDYELQQVLFFLFAFKMK